MPNATVRANARALLRQPSIPTPLSLSSLSAVPLHGRDARLHATSSRKPINAIGRWNRPRRWSRRRRMTRWASLSGTASGKWRCRVTSLRGYLSRPANFARAAHQCAGFFWAVAGVMQSYDFPEGRPFCCAGCDTGHGNTQGVLLNHF